MSAAYEQLIHPVVYHDIHHNNDKLCHKVDSVSIRALIFNLAFTFSFTLRLEFLIEPYTVSVKKQIHCIITESQN